MCGCVCVYDKNLKFNEIVVWPFVNRGASLAESINERKTWFRANLTAADQTAGIRDRRFLLA